MKTKLFLITNLLFLCVCGNAQSGWTRAKNSGYFKLAAYMIAGDQYYGVNGNFNAGANNYYQQALTVYGEYGITKNITAIVNYPFLKFQHFEGYSNSIGTGNPQVELKFSVYKIIPVSFSVGAEIPISAQDNFIYAKTPNPLGSYDYYNLPTGYPDFSYWGTLAVSGSWGNLPGWTSLFTQYIVRGNGYSNQLKTGLEIGYRWAPQFYTNARLVGFFQTQKNIQAKAGSFTNGQGTEFTTLGFGAGYKFSKKFTATFDYQFYNDLLVSRKNVYSTPFFQLGIAAEL